MLLALVHTWALVVVSLLDLGMSLNCLHHCHRVVVGCGDSQDLHVLHAWVQHLLHRSLELVFQLFFLVHCLSTVAWCSFCLSAVRPCKAVSPAIGRAWL